MYEDLRFFQNSCLKHTQVCVNSFKVKQMIYTIFNNHLKEIMKSFNRSKDKGFIKDKLGLIINVFYTHTNRGVVKVYRTVSKSKVKYINL